MIKGSSHQEGITILNIYAQNKTASKCLKEKPIEPQGETDKPTIWSAISIPLEVKQVQRRLVRTDKTSKTLPCFPKNKP